MKIFAIVFAKIVAIFLVIFAIIIGSYYLIYETNYLLLDDKTLLSFASVDVLGNPKYGKSCPRSSYASDVMILHTSVKDRSAFFKFHPIVGKEIQCPSIVIIVDRRTGEGWIDQAP